MVASTPSKRKVSGEEILTELRRRVNAADLVIYQMQLHPDPEHGWDATFKAIGSRQSEYALQFMHIVNAMRQEFDFRISPRV